MKKANHNRGDEAEATEMLPEYGLAGKRGVRGKYYRVYCRGHTVKVYQEDGTVCVQHFASQED